MPRSQKQKSTQKLSRNHKEFLNLYLGLGFPRIIFKSGIDNDFAECCCFATTGCATTEESLTQIPQIGKDFCAMKSGIDNDFAEGCCFATIWLRDHCGKDYEVRPKSVTVCVRYKKAWMAS